MKEKPIIYHISLKTIWELYKQNPLTKGFCLQGLEPFDSEQELYEFIDFRDSLMKYINESEDYSIYITELELPSCNGLDLARYIRNNTNDWTSPIIIMDIDSSMYYDLLNQKLQILDFIPKLDSLYKSLSEDIDICLRILYTCDIR